MGSNLRSSSYVVRSRKQRPNGRTTVTVVDGYGRVFGLTLRHRFTTAEAEQVAVERMLSTVPLPVKTPAPCWI